MLLLTLAQLTNRNPNHTQEARRPQNPLIGGVRTPMRVDNSGQRETWEAEAALEDAKNGARGQQERRACPLVQLQQQTHQRAASWNTSPCGFWRPLLLRGAPESAAGRSMVAAGGIAVFDATHVAVRRHEFDEITIEMREIASVRDVDIVMRQFFRLECTQISLEREKTDTLQTERHKTPSNSNPYTAPRAEPPTPSRRVCKILLRTRMHMHT
jgi:hypothetical protein